MYIYIYTDNNIHGYKNISSFVVVTVIKKISVFTEDEDGKKTW